VALDHEAAHPLVAERLRHLVEPLLRDRQERRLARREEHLAGERDHHAALLLAHRRHLAEAREGRLGPALGLDPRGALLLELLRGLGLRLLGLVEGALGLAEGALGLHEALREGGLTLALRPLAVTLGAQGGAARVGDLRVAQRHVGEVARLGGARRVAEGGLGDVEALARGVEVDQGELGGGAGARLVVGRAGLQELARRGRRGAGGEDIKALGGVKADEEISDSVWTTAKGRFRWLLINLVTAFLATTVLKSFEHQLEAMVALAILAPIVASQGGSAATQTMTVAVRALATRELGPRNAWRIVRREAMVGLINGLGFAVITGAVASFWFTNASIGAVIGLALVCNLVAGSLGGVLVPLTLDRMKIDPAISSGPFVTTVTDVVGFFSFLTIATWWFRL
jgi:cation transporter-like permease